MTEEDAFRESNRKFFDSCLIVALLSIILAVLIVGALK